MTKLKVYMFSNRLLKKICSCFLKGEGLQHKAIEMMKVKKILKNKFNLKAIISNIAVIYYN